MQLTGAGEIQSIALFVTDVVSHWLPDNDTETPQWGSIDGMAMGG